MKPNWRMIHASLAVFWAIAIIPTVLFWSNSVLWIGLISCYANSAAHFSGYQGARAEDAA
jgi:uncharacterized membrane protein